MFGDYRAESGYTLCRRLLTSGPVPTALFCGNDRMAFGAYFALAELGLRVPDDVSVLGYDDQEEFAESMHPALSTIQLPYYEMGRHAVEHIVDGTVASLPKRSLTTCPPVARASVGAPRKHALS